jgi:hypothetical protein
MSVIGGNVRPPSDALGPQLIDGQNYEAAKEEIPSSDE